MKYKLIACDLDGTLLDDNSVFTEKNADAVKKITESGVNFAVVTGRTFYEIPKEVRECKYIDYVIYSDGAVAINRNSSKVLFSKYFSNDSVREIFNLLDSFDTMIELYEDGRPVTDKEKISEDALNYYSVDENYRSVIFETRIGVDDLSEHVKKSVKTEIFNVFFKNSEERLECMRQLKTFDDISFTTSMENNLEIMPLKVSKGKALSRLCDMLNIPYSKVIAVGDSSNDVTMYAYAGLSLAPSNASEEIQKIAGRVICSNNDGVADYIFNNVL
ncbi:MAG: Cof-type HAD-IIB family hydrolase [Eubacterium sp.]